MGLFDIVRSSFDLGPDLPSANAKQKTLKSLVGP